MFVLPASFFEATKAVGKRLPDSIKGAEHSVILYEEENRGGLIAFTINSMLLTSTPTEGEIGTWMEAVTTDAFKKGVRAHTDSPDGTLQISADKREVKFNDVAVASSSASLMPLDNVKAMLTPKGETIVRLTFPVASLAAILGAMAAMSESEPNQVKETKNDNPVVLDLVKVESSTKGEATWRIICTMDKPYKNHRIVGVVGATDAKETNPKAAPEPAKKKGKK